MKDITLVIMAAGMGSRYGGLKQIDPIGPNGEIIIDFSVYDAIRAGFNKIVFVIKKEIEHDFKEAIGNKLSGQVKVEYVYQDIHNLPEGCLLPEGRVKPWGTGHAVLSCKDVVNEPFAVINADDYYGREAFELLYKELSENSDEHTFCMVGYNVANTLTENGHVSRGVCEISEEGQLTSITERTRIEKRGAGIMFTEDGEGWTEIPSDSIVSMNCWGFSPLMIEELNRRFGLFLEKNKENILKAEYFLPFVVDELIKENRAKVKVLVTDEKWYGVTYKEDKEKVMSAVKDMIAAGKYPKGLWNNEL